MQKKRIHSFYDLDVYQGTYNASITVHKEIMPKLPKEEEKDLKDQLRRSSKAVPRLIAEAFSKRHQNKGYQKYIDDAMQESNECIVCLSHTKDIYQIEPVLCVELIDIYDKASRQLYNLSLAWQEFDQRKRITKPDTRNRFVTATATD